MDAKTADHGIWFSTDLLPPRERLPYLREAFGRSIARLELGLVERQELKWSASLHMLDGVGVTQGRTNGNICRRTQPLLTDGNDDFLFTTNLSGFSLPSQVGRECRLDAGAATLLSSCDVGGQDFPGPANFLTLRIPRRRLLGMAVKPEDALARPIPAATEALRLLVNYVDVVLNQNRLTSPQVRQLAAAHISDLVALAIGATRETFEAARDRGLRAARLCAIKEDIRERLANEDLSVAAVARRRGVTPRYVQLLFESEGATFTDYVLGQRLELARRMLTDPARRGLTISAIAFEVGFGNLSYFNRMFRRRFEETPSDLKRRHMAETYHS